MRTGIIQSFTSCIASDQVIGYELVTADIAIDLALKPVQDRPKFIFFRERFHAVSVLFLSLSYQALYLNLFLKLQGEANCWAFKAA